MEQVNRVGKISQRPSKLAPFSFLKAALLCDRTVASGGGTGEMRPHRPHALIHLLLLAFALAASSYAAGPSSDLEQGFRNPPESARPYVYWFIMDGNLTWEGITADFEALKRAGVGGVIMMEVDVGIPRGPVKFMSAEWRTLFKHAVTEAERLGLQITLNAGPGWTGSGGPWVKPEQSMQHLVASAVDVTGRSASTESCLARSGVRRFSATASCHRSWRRRRTSFIAT